MGSDKPFHNPFGALAKLRGEQGSDAPADSAAPAAPSPSSAPTRAPASAPASPSGGKTIPRVVVRMERKGRGGKEVTVLEQLTLTPILRERWLKDLKAALGCGGVIEGSDIMLQGDHRKRLPALLTKMGVKVVTVAG
jgi:translation initiation factor 1